KECFQLGGNNKFSKKEKKRIQSDLEKNANKILFVLDGYDDLSVSQSKIRAFWEDLMRSDYSVLITSRPGTTMVPNNILFETRLAVLGFNDAQVESYIKKFFD